MVPLAGRWTAEMQQVPDDVPETAGFRFHLYNERGEDFYQEDQPIEDRELWLIEVGAGTYTLKSRRLDAEGHEFGDEVASAPLEVRPGTTLRLVMTSLQLRIGETDMAAAKAAKGARAQAQSAHKPPEGGAPARESDKEGPKPPESGARGADTPRPRGEEAERPRR